MRVDSVQPGELADGDIAAWRDLLAADPELSSPYLTPDWAQLVARHRADVRVAVWRDDAGKAHGFLPVQRTSAYAALPAGGPVCDYQALIAAKDAGARSLAGRASARRRPHRSHRGSHATTPSRRC